MKVVKPDNLFRVYSAGRKVEGEFPNKRAAKAARNALISEHGAPYWVGYGPAHRLYKGN